MYPNTASPALHSLSLNQVSGFQLTTVWNIQDFVPSQKRQNCSTVRWLFSQVSPADISVNVFTNSKVLHEANFLLARPILQFLNHAFAQGRCDSFPFQTRSTQILMKANENCTGSAHLRDRRKDKPSPGVIKPSQARCLPPLICS